jgi:hypothetical protein
MASLLSFVARTALNILAYDMPSVDGKQCQLRIGINSSEVIAGVVGSTKLHYDVWENAVNIAARMESQGEPGRIQLAPAPAPSSTTTSPACCVGAGNQGQGRHADVVTCGGDRWNRLQFEYCHLGPRRSNNVKALSFKNTLPVHWHLDL